MGPLALTALPAVRWLAGPCRLLQTDISRLLAWPLKDDPLAGHMVARLSSFCLPACLLAYGFAYIPTTD